jgi:hypothetical protein
MYVSDTLLEKDKIRVALNGITSTQSFVKTNQLIKNGKVGHADRGLKWKFKMRTSQTRWTSEYILRRNIRCQNILRFAFVGQKNKLNEVLYMNVIEIVDCIFSAL